MLCRVQIGPWAGEAEPIACEWTACVGFDDKQPCTCIEQFNKKTGHRLMKDVALIEADGNGFWLIDLFGERRFVTGKIQSLNLTDGQCLLMRKPALA
ncbi:MAG: CooT family nickel-binding protein [Desulfobacterales bacterium]